MLGGCAVIAGGAAGGALGFAAGSLANPLNDIQDANVVLRLDAPVKKLDCILLKKTVAANPGLATYCNHVPTNIGDAIMTWGLVFEAMKTGKAQ